MSNFNAWQLQGYNAEQIDLINKAAASGDYGDDPNLEAPPPGGASTP